MLDRGPSYRVSASLLSSQSCQGGKNLGQVSLHVTASTPALFEVLTRSQTTQPLAGSKPCKITSARLSLWDGSGVPEPWCHHVRLHLLLTFSGAGAIAGEDEEKIGKKGICMKAKFSCVSSGRQKIRASACTASADGLAQRASVCSRYSSSVVVQIIKNNNEREVFMPVL